MPDNVAISGSYWPGRALSGPSRVLPGYHRSGPCHPWSGPYSPVRAVEGNITLSVVDLDCGGSSKARLSHSSQAKLTMSMSASMQANERFMGLQALGEQLIPGIPDEITVDHIATKLDWTDCNNLSSVSQVWLYAIRSHRVHDARVRSHSTKTLLLAIFLESDGVRKGAVMGSTETFALLESDGFHMGALIGPTGTFFRELPPIPNLEGRFPRCCQVVLFVGKVFVLGGMVEPKYGRHSTDKVYYLDLAGRRQWKQCASMGNSRMRFKCGFLNGKIYVFGGLSLDQPVPGSEVYDADEDTWSSIEPTISLQYEHRVNIVGTSVVELDGTNLFYYMKL